MSTIDLGPFADLVELDHGLSVVATLRADHSPQATVVNAGVLPHPLTGSDVVGFVTAGIGLPFYTSMECWAKKAAAARGINLLWQGSQSYSPRDEMQALHGNSSRHDN